MLIALLTAGACVDPATFGAKPDDGKSDTVAIQQAIDQAASRNEAVCLGKGVFLLEKSSTRRQWGSLVIHDAVEMYGVGPTTILRMSGSGGKNDWRAISIANVEGVALHDFTIDGLEAYDTEEQTHLLEIAPGSSNIDIRRMVFGPMRKPTDPVGGGIGGDCIRLLGKVGAEVTDVSITNSKFVACDRSGISLQRAVRRLLIARVSIVDTGDQAVDFEPTGKGDIQDIVMLELDVKHHPNAQGSDVIAIGGNRDDRARGVILADSKIDGGGIRMIDVENVQLLRNTIDFGARKKMPVISIMRRADDVVVANNSLRRPSGAQPGAIIAATHLDKRIPRGVRFEHNKVVQETPAPIVNMNSVGSVVVRRNDIDYRGGDPSIPIVTLTATAGDVDNLTFVDNTIVGGVRALVSLGARDHHIAKIDVRGNRAAATKFSIVCAEGNGGYSKISGDDSSIRQAKCNRIVISPQRTW